MRIRGKLISSFGAVTLTILLVYSVLVYISLAENIRQDRAEAYSSRVKAAVLTAEMQIWQQKDGLLHGNTNNSKEPGKASLFSGLRVLTFDDISNFSFQAFEKETKIHLPDSWKSSHFARVLGRGPQLLFEGDRSILLQFEPKGKALVCYLFEVNSTRLIA
ncbi:MAG: hypothetical protein P8130_14160, partial [Deltaproteobacteria bacterium]